MVELVGLVAVVLLLAWSVLAYNGLLAGQNRARKAWASLELQLRRRHDVALALCDALRPTGDDRGVTEIVERVRNAAAAEPDSVAGRERVENELSDALTELRAAAGASAELEASEAILDLRAELDAAEKRIAVTQQSYNDTVARYDARRRRPGSSVIAGIGPFEPVDPFAARTDSRTSTGT